MSILTIEVRENQNKDFRSQGDSSLFMEICQILYGRVHYVAGKSNLQAYAGRTKTNVHIECLII